MASKGWSRRFDDPIPLPDGGKLATLREAIAYFAKTVPKADRGWTINKRGLHQLVPLGDAVPTLGLPNCCVTICI